MEQVNQIFVCVYSYIYIYINLMITTGKSTTISILTGLLLPSRGTVNIFGNDLSTDLHKIRQMTGIW